MSRKILMLSVFLYAGLQSHGQEITGIWKNIEKDEIQSHIEVFESDGKTHARVIELFPTSHVTHCKKCKGADKGASLKDIMLINNMRFENEKWIDGDILDPKSGKKYACQVELKGDNTLKIRGYIGNPLLGKTFYWYRVE